ncbi:MAG TPA: F0F1 ATP synthase subunit B' [Stellaceae bacterium]|nr:F0F1 ATP synthase subunit B' [Stellaceae bacterium]
MPQLEFATFVPQLIWLGITFLLLYGLMAWLGLPKVGAIIAQRKALIEGDLDKANRMKAESETVLAAYERALATARAEAQATMKEAIERLNAQSSERLRQMAETLAREGEAAERRIDAARQAAMASLAEVAVDVVRSATGKLLGHEIDAARARSAVEAAMRERG